MFIRVCDFLFSGISLFFLLPLFLVIIFVLKFTGEGEIFFLQERVGKRKKMFKLFKFVTMLKNSPKIGTGTVTLKDDPRILPVGSFLRKTKINELPQLLNVFLGHMSLIGPRPQTQRCFNAFPIKSQKIISKVKPGLSGIGPIVFHSEENILEKHNDIIDFYDNVIGPYKGDVEAWYVKKRNIFIYLSLILITIWVVIFPNSGIVWKAFKDLPVPPADLKSNLNFPF
ncbi:MAG: lipid carrier--UDP-N-acetylgalactosaminyltransferase [Candidatus Marinimicrobia bacterium]|nr:lipid carrier--UDP-N-acetylgalactosaminyltransferase [Candidatus Neomarinimicrobiota bacterium]|tara:strand:+ start:133 stop:813 length:681 start_codon:yes stop_codon:yes gene_type:complete